MCREGSCWGEGFPMELCALLPMLSVRRHRTTFNVNLEKNWGGGAVIFTISPKKEQSQPVSKTNQGPATSRPSSGVWGGQTHTD